MSLLNTLENIMITIVRNAPVSVWLEHLSHCSEQAAKHLDAYATGGDNDDLVACYHYLTTAVRASRQAQLRLQQDKRQQLEPL
jgi:hypothetical protein